MQLYSSDCGQAAWEGECCEEVETHRPHEQNSGHSVHFVEQLAAIDTMCGSLENVSGPTKDDPCLFDVSKLTFGLGIECGEAALKPRVRSFSADIDNNVLVRRLRSLPRPFERQNGGSPLSCDASDAHHAHDLEERASLLEDVTNEVTQEGTMSDFREGCVTLQSVPMMTPRFNLPSPNGHYSVFGSARVVTTWESPDPSPLRATYDVADRFPKWPLADTMDTLSMLPPADMSEEDYIAAAVVLPCRKQILGL